MTFPCRSYVVFGVASFFLNLSIKKRATPLVNIICYITLNKCFFYVLFLLLFTNKKICKKHIF